MINKGFAPNPKLSKRDKEIFCYKSQVVTDAEQGIHSSLNPNQVHGTDQAKEDQGIPAVT